MTEKHEPAMPMYDKPNDAHLAYDGLTAALDASK